MKTKTTIITLAALTLGIAATQAVKPGTTEDTNGSGVVVTVAAAESQHQHANGATLTFNPKVDASTIWCYKVKGYNYTLTTPDNKQQKGDIIGTIGSWNFLTIDKPSQRQVTNNQKTFTPARLLSGKNLSIVYAFTNAAALTGTIDLLVDVYPSAPTGADLNGKIEAPVFALADSQPTITWSLNPTFTKK